MKQTIEKVNTEYRESLMETIKVVADIYEQNALFGRRETRRLCKEIIVNLRNEMRGKPDGIGVVEDIKKYA